MLFRPITKKSLMMGPISVQGSRPVQDELRSTGCVKEREAHCLLSMVQGYIGIIAS
jgi:hypothetical protein